MIKMSVNDIKEAMKNESVYFGLKETLKNIKKVKNVFVSKDARSNTLKVLDEKKIKYKILKDREEMSKLLDLNFTSEVFSIR